mgnify:CR=1 FL=1
MNDLISVSPGESRLETSRAGLFSAGISVFFPAYNDAPSLPSLLERTFEVLKRRAADYEVIVVNDGSADDTGAVLEQLRLRYAPYLRVVTHESNRGYGGALRSGFAAATKEWVFYTDGDGQYDPAELETLLRCATPSVGLVNGYKTERHDPWHRVAIGFLYNQFARMLFGIKLRDIDCDFRLIRRGALEGRALESTSGTICVELVKKLEDSGCEVVEVPVRHYPRTHGRSQFFRLRSLAATFVQLCRLYLTLVLMPALRGLWSGPVEQSSVSRRFIASALCAITVLAVIPYLRSLALPPIADDYLQIQVARDYAPPKGWRGLAADALYRCRATSLLFTYWTERLFGIDPVVLGVSSLLLHVVNSLLVFALGSWRMVGWRVAAFAACFFAVSEHHQEAVIWYAAVHELLVFLFSIASVLLWLRWLDRGRGSLYAGSFAMFTLALFSKESAVALVPVFLMISLLEGRSIRRAVAALAPMALLALAYFGAAYVSRGEHQHFNDGTFDLAAPFVATLARSTGRLLWIWGVAALCALACWRAKNRAGLAILAFVWMGAMLLPYSFLTYMPRIPSRHTYLASLGLSLIVGAAFVELWSRARIGRLRWAVPAVAGLIVIQQAGYVAVTKHRHYELRAAPTEELVRAVSRSTDPVVVGCFPYHVSIAQNAVRIRVGEGGLRNVVFNAAEHRAPHALNLCNKVAYASPR